MFGAQIDALNSTLSFSQALEAEQENLLNANNFGYKQRRSRLEPTSFGVVLRETGRDQSPGALVVVDGEKVTKLAIGDEHPGAYFLVRDGEQEYLTRLGDFKYTYQQRAPNTYIGQPHEERTYLTTQDGYLVMGRPIGRGPVEQVGRFQDPFRTGNDVLGEAPVKTSSKTIGENVPLQKGPMVPIDLTRGKNGLILDRYEKVETTDDGIIRGFRDGLWVPLYKVSLVSVPNPSGLAAIDDTPYRLETEASGLRTNAPEGVKLYSERVEKSNVNLKLSSYEYQKLRNNVTLANSLQRSNAQLLQQFQQLLNS